jgi:threonine/homoserine efflux transporter RhtA
MSESKEPEAGELPSRDPMYRAVVALLIGDVVVGLGLAVFAAAVLDTRPVAFLGLAMALLGIAVLAFYIAIGARADRRAKVADSGSAERDQ